MGMKYNFKLAIIYKNEIKLKAKIRKIHVSLHKVRKRAVEKKQCF